MTFRKQIDSKWNVGTNQKFPWILLLASFIPAFSGCKDGPMYGLKKLNPYYQRQWAEDRKLGPVFDDRLNEIKSLASRMRSLSEEEQKKWLNDLDQLIQYDPSPDIRRQAVFAMRDIRSSEAVPILNRAAKDRSEKVQLAACSVLGDRKEAEAVEILGSMARNSKSMSIRSAAIRGLGKHPIATTKPIFAEFINDKSPVIQYECVLALQRSTEMNFGGDVSEWKKYLADQPVSPKPKSFVQQVSSIVPARD